MVKAPRYFLGLTLAVGLAVATQACAAQTYGYPGGGYSRDLERRAYDNGYREGVQEGQNDARRNRDFSYQRHDEYRDADRGFRRSDGDINLYRRSFRSGFQTGYSESYNRYARNSEPSNRSGFRSPAAANGYRDGIEAGRSDEHDRVRFDPIRAKRYREGDHDYDRRYGSREDYTREYRAAFEQGYREGYGAARR
jgi:hypothetical protein